MMRHVVENDVRFAVRDFGFGAIWMTQPFLMNTRLSRIVLATSGSCFGAGPCDVQAPK